MIFLRTFNYRNTCLYKCRKKRIIYDGLIKITEKPDFARLSLSVIVMN